MEGMVTSDQKEKPKRFWSYIKAKKQESTGVAPLKNIDGFIHSSSQSKAEILNAQFQSVFTVEDLSSMPDKGPSPYASMEDIKFNTKGVHKQLTQLNTHKATGPDNIPTAILRLAADELAPVLTRFYQYSYDHGTVPQDWRDAHIVPVFKKGERHQPANYRPVSLTSVASKIMEHIIHSSIMRFYDSHKILHDCQHGFRAKRSCETQLIGTLHSIARRLKGRNQVDVVQLDFSKAFDKVPHQRLMYKLQYYGVRGNTATWIQSFLSNRKQKVLLEGEMSSEKDVLSGVPQGTVLGPLLFLTYINDLPDCVTSSETKLFADDSLLFREIKSQQDADCLQKDLTALEKWEADWQMSFHPEKCTVTRIHASKNSVINTTYTLHGQVLQTTDSSKYLGVTLSDDLDWQKHVDMITTKANRTLGFIRRNLGDCNKRVKASAYMSMVRPTLEYSSTVWDPKPQKLQHKLEQVQRKAARFVHSAYTERTPGCVTKMVQDLSWDSLEHRRYIARLLMIFKIHHQIVEVSGSTDILQLNDSRTRGSHRFKQTIGATSIFRDSFFPRTISDWNHLPTVVTNCTTMEAFRAGLGSLAPTH